MRGIGALRSFSGASVRRVIDYSHACVAEHAHDWPLLSLFVIGSYWNRTELGEHFICGPSAIFYRAGAAHRNRVAEHGFRRILGRTPAAVREERRSFRRTPM